MKLKAYPKYNPSSVEWLGDSPEEWDIKRLKCLISTNDNALPETTDPNYEMLYVDISSIDPVRGIVNKEPFIFENAPSRARRIVKDGDTIVSTVRTYLRAIAPIDNPEQNLIVSTGFAVLRPRKILPRYLSFVMRSPYVIETIVSRSVGVSYPAINASEIGFIKISVPASDEQEKIVYFLDRETGKIDELISKKEILIERLKEKRTAMISRVVTKGLNPDVHLKPSAVEWLGDVPEHWIVRKLKYSVKAITGFAFSSDDYVDEGIPLIRIGDILENGTVDAENAKKLPEDYLGNYRFCQINNHNILMAMTGATIGKAGRYCNSNPGLLNQRVCMFRSSLMDEDYLWYLLKTPQYFEHIKLTGFGGAQPNISDRQMLNFTALLPPLPEQRSIAEHLDRETGKIDALAEKVHMAIEKLKEYRTALISAAVTGKIDVRNAINA